MKKIANPLKNAIEQNGLTVYPVENTYLADHLLKNGSIPESALDHMYYSKSIKDRIECKISEVSATDHVPVITSYKIGKSRAKIYSKNITKRCLKNFSERYFTCKTAFG